MRNIMINKILASCRELAEIPPDAAEAFIQARNRLRDNVNSQLEVNPKIGELTGRNPLELIRNHLKNHAMLMAAVLRMNSFELLPQTIPWIYRTYHARGFSYDYFPAELVAWQIAIYECLDHSVPKAEILAVYKWMLQHHEDMVELSITPEAASNSVKLELNELQQEFLLLLLNGDCQNCLKRADQSVSTSGELKHFYLNVIWPVMYKIGELWESAQISVAEEHLATAIVGRIMAACYTRFARFEITRGKAVVSAGPNEFHEIGARMVADFLEMDGWDVTYLGANTPVGEIHEILKSIKPFMLALSVATVFNIDNAGQVVLMIRKHQETRNIKVMIGGLAFNGVPPLWQDIGADGHAADAESAVALSEKWWMERNL